jgi:hypothetical protein
MDEAERALFIDALRSVTAARTGAALDTALLELGWADALEADLPSAVAVLFEASGEANVTSSALDSVLAAALGLPDPVPAAVVLPPLRASGTPGVLEGSQLTVRGIGTNALARTDTVIVVAVAGDHAEAFVVPASSLKVEPALGLDPALGLADVSAEITTTSLPAPASVDWATGAAIAQLALGHELVGAGRAMLELARAHALERIQFGRPIASFQAVRHRLAESLVALEAASALLAASWDEPTPTAGAMAKALAGRSTRTVARHCQQVLAGIGFTTEHSLHRYVRRTIVLDQLLGAGTVLTRQLGADVLASGSLPASFPL